MKQTSILYQKSALGHKKSAMQEQNKDIKCYLTEIGSWKGEECLQGNQERDSGGRYLGEDSKDPRALQSLPIINN